MRFLISLLLLHSVLTAQTPRAITLEDIWVNGSLAAKNVPGFNFRIDGLHYTKIEGAQIVQYDIRSGMKDGLVLDAKNLTNTPKSWAGAFDGYTFSADEQKMLLATESESIYRYSSKAHYFVYDANTKKLSRLWEGAKQRYPLFSPDGSKIAFIVDNDLYIKNIENGAVTRITTDGRENAIINGASDWVYEEEFELVRAFEWSRDGKKLAFFRFDESAVPEMSMEAYSNQAYPEQITFKYPKVGEKNAVVTPFVYDLDADKLVEVRHNQEADSYLPRLAWTPGGELCLTWMNRHQNHQKLLAANPNSGECRVLHEEKNKYYLDLHDVYFLPDGSGFILQSEKSGFNHLYRYDMNGREMAALTKGNWDVTALYGVDARNGLVFFQAAAHNAMERELYSVKWNGKGMKKLSGKPPGYYSAQFGSTWDYRIQSYTTINTPPQYAIYDRKGKLVRRLEQNEALRSKQAEYGTAPVTFFKMPLPPAAIGTDSGRLNSKEAFLNGWMIRPTAPEFAGQKLPVLMFVYGGPGSQQVTEQWKGANYWWFQMLAQQGYVVACVDNRGTGARGEYFKKLTYMQLGRYETEDQMAAARYLSALPFVDPQRVGIFGWSYGGYMSSLCLLKGNTLFKAGIAVAPVTNWKWYDNIYTERYMRTHAENTEGYEENSPVNFADQLTGNYLLVHGLADDNVHFQHSAEMSNQLIHYNKQFDTMIYPNKNHSIGGAAARLHLYRLMTDFLNEKLKGAAPTAKP